MFKKNRLEEKTTKLKPARRRVSFIWHLFHCGFLDAVVLFVVGLALVLFSMYLWWVGLSWFFNWTDTWPSKIFGWVFLWLQFSATLLELGFMKRFKNDPREIKLTYFFAASFCLNLGSVINFLSVINAFPEIRGQTPLVAFTSMTGPSSFMLVTIMLTALLTYVPKLFWDATKMTSDGWSQLRLCLKSTQELDFVKN
jgi:hypothetical protein